MIQKSHDDRMLWAQFDSLEMGTGWDDTDILKPQIDPAGTVYLFSLNRARADADVVLTAGSGRTLACFGRVILHALPLPGRT